MLGVKLTPFWVEISLRRARLDLVNNNLGANVFPAGETNVGKGSMAAEMPSRASYLVYYMYYIYL